MYPALRRAAPALLVAVSAVAIVSRFDSALGGSGAEVSAGPDATTEPSALVEPATPASPTPADSPSAQPEPVACAGGGEEALGPVVSTRWGPTQVSAVVDAGVICSATAVRYPDGDSRSAMLSERAISIIDVEVAETGDASFDAVSGATVTSEGYRDSLQAILDQA